MVAEKVDDAFEKATKAGLQKLRIQNTAPATQNTAPAIQSTALAPSGTKHPLDPLVKKEREENLETGLSLSRAL